MYNFKNPKDAYKISQEFAKKGKKALFPPYVTFELVSACNFKCLMCPTSYVKRQGQEMDFKLFQKIVDEIAEYGSLIRFIGFSEPLLYGKIKEAIRYVKQKNLLLHITTNGALLGKEMTKEVIDSQANSVIVSMQGLSPTEYCKMRNIAMPGYNQVLKNIQFLYNNRKDKKPEIKITTTITSRDDLKNKDKFLKACLAFADESQVTNITHFSHLDEQLHKKDIWAELGIKKPKKIKKVACFLPNYELSIRPNGECFLCCGAFFGNGLSAGNVKEKTISNIWNSEKADKTRQEISDGNLEKFQDCSVCPVRYRYKNVYSCLKNENQ